MRTLFAVLAITVMMSCDSTDDALVWVIEHPEHDLISEPVFAELSSDQLPEGDICMVSEDEVYPVQIQEVDRQQSRVWWVVSQSAGSTKHYELTRDVRCNEASFEWEHIGEHSDRLYYDDQPVIQYEYPAFDFKDIEHTKKPFHHVFDPAGEEKITKGPGGLYSHHRGIFLGYYAYVNDQDERIDIWHARDGERSEHNRVLRKIEGPVKGGHDLLIDWKDHDGNPFVEEERRIRVFRQPEGEMLMEVTSTLTAVKDKVILGGDRHHAGLQFRAAQAVAEHPESTRFIRPAERRHIPPDEELGDENNLDFPWNAMFFEIDDRTWTVAYLSHPDNPDGAEMSERKYGRFGEYIPYELSKNESLELNYRFWITKGEALSGDEIQRRYERYGTSISIDVMRGR